MSTDPSDESARFAKDYGITFPLLSDVDGKVSAQYTAIDRADITVPGIVVIHDGKIVFRQIAETRDDRLTATQLVREIDRALGTRGAGVAAGYAAFQRVHVRFDLGGGTNDGRATSHASLAALYPLHRYLLGGVSTRGDFRDGMIDIDAALAVRIPLLADIAAIQLTGTGGWTLINKEGPHASARIGAWLALNPTWAFQLDAGFGLHQLDAEPLREVFVTFGLTRLFRVR